MRVFTMGDERVRRSWPSSWTFQLALLVGAFVTLVAGCGTASSSSSPSVGSGEQVLRYCGQTLSESVAAIFDMAATGGDGTVPAGGIFPGTRLALQLTTSCTNGVAIAISPPGIITVAKSARTADGRVAAIILTALAHGTATMTVNRPNGVVTTVTVPVS